MILVIGATYTKKMNAISAAKMFYISEATSMVEQVIKWFTIILLVGTKVIFRPYLLQNASIWAQIDIQGLHMFQTVSQIKTVFAFVGENTAIKSFSECLEKQFSLSKGEALIKGVGTGMLQTVTFCAWSLVIWIGALAVHSRKARGGDVIAAVMSILFGSV